MINARFVPLAEKPTDKGLFKNKLLRIPMDGFYEWRLAPSTDRTTKGKPAKQPIFLIERLDRIDDPERRLRALFAESFGDVVSGPIDALLVGQIDDPVVGPTVVRATAERLDFLTRTYRDLGLPRERAAARARLAYAAYLGISHLRRIPGALRRPLARSRLSIASSRFS